MDSLQQRDTGEMQQDTLRQLVIDAQAGNQKALESFVTMITPIIQRIIYSMLPRTNPDRDDLAQDALLIVLEKMSCIRNPDAAIAWISVMTKRQVWNYCRRILPRRGQELPYDVIADQHAIDISPDAGLLSSERDALVHRVLGEMGPRDAEVLRMFYYDDLSYAQILERLSQEQSSPVPMGTVKRQIHTARNRFAEKVQGNSFYKNELSDSCCDD